MNHLQPYKLHVVLMRISFFLCESLQVPINICSVFIWGIWNFELVNKFPKFWGMKPAVIRSRVSGSSGVLGWWNGQKVQARLIRYFVSFLVIDDFSWWMGLLKIMWPIFKGSSTSHTIGQSEFVADNCWCLSRSKEDKMFLRFDIESLMPSF